MKLDPDVYREAAELIITYKDSACCNAIAKAVFRGSSYPYRKAFARVFRPEFAGGYWWSTAYPYTPSDPRIIALLLMADIVESENKSPRKPMKKRLTTLLSKASATLPPQKPRK